MSKEFIVWADGRALYEEREMRCALGLKGVTSHKEEGDGCTPLGAFAIREVLYRSDRIEMPEIALPAEELRPEDGWCTDPMHEEYNTHISLPHTGAYEELWRDDHIYDIILPLGYNDDPALPGKGSAIFLHVARESYAPTEGCVALSMEDLLYVLRSIGQGSVVAIRQA